LTKSNQKAQKLGKLTISKDTMQKWQKKSRKKKHNLRIYRWKLSRADCIFGSGTRRI